MERQTDRNRQTQHDTETNRQRQTETDGDRQTETEGSEVGRDGKCVGERDRW